MKASRRSASQKRHQFLGLDAYQDVIDSGVDVVLLATPPGFRPQHLKASIEAGKHVFCEKPMAVDVPGVRSVIDTAKLRREQATIAGRWFLLALQQHDRRSDGPATFG